MTYLDQNLIEKKAIELEKEFERLLPLGDEGVQSVYALFGQAINDAKKGLIKKPISFGSYLKYFSEVTGLPSSDCDRFTSAMVDFDWAVSGKKGFLPTVNKPLAEKYARIIFSYRQDPRFVDFSKNRDFMNLLNDILNKKRDDKLDISHHFELEFRSFDFSKIGHDELTDALAKLYAAMNGDQNIA